MAGHFSGLGDAEQADQGGGDVCQNTVAHLDLVLIRATVDEVHQVGGVCGVGGSIGVEHVLAVTVVSADEAAATEFEDFFNALFQGFVNSLTGGDAGLQETGVAHHVGVSEVHDGDVVIGNSVHKLVSHLADAHLGLEVVGSHLAWGGDEDAVFALELGFNTTVEEESDVGVFFRLSDAELFEACGGNDLAEDVGELLLLKHHGGGVASLVLRHGDVVNVRVNATVKAIEVVIDEGAGELAGAVCTEVEEEYDVFIAHTLSVGLAEDAGFKEFVRHAVSIAFFSKLSGGASAGLALTEDDGIPADLNAVPAFVAIHGIETANNGSNLGTVGGNGILQLLEESCATLGIGVATIGDGMNHDVFHTGFRSNLYNADEVVNVGVHATVGNKPEQVKTRTDCLGERFRDDGVLGQGTIIDGVGNAAEVLKNNATGTQVEVADLGVAHLTIGQTYILPGSPQHGVRASGEQFVSVRSGGEHGGITCLLGGLRPLRVAAPAVTNNKYNGFVCHAVILAVLCAFVKPK